MEVIFYLIIFIFGLIVGSFLNCVIYRLEKEESFIKGKSYCPHCRHTLSWQDLIPVLSFLILRGKCRYCHQKISWQYPLVELATGLLFLSIFNLQNLLSTSYQLLITSFLIVIFVFDLKHYIIPDRVIYPAIAIVSLFRILDLGLVSDFVLRISDFKTLVNPFLSAILASAFFLSIVLVSKGRWMGIGDIKLAFFMGLVLSWPNILVALFLAFSIGAIIGLGMIAAGQKKLSSEIPFGPFLVSGTFIAMLFGGQLISWYMNLILL